MGQHRAVFQSQVARAEPARQPVNPNVPLVMLFLEVQRSEPYCECPQPEKSPWGRMAKA